MPRKDVIFCPFCDGDITEQARGENFLLCPHCNFLFPLEKAKRRFSGRRGFAEPAKAFNNELKDLIGKYRLGGLSDTALRKTLAAHLTESYKRIPPNTLKNYSSKEIYPVELLKLVLVVRDIWRDRQKLRGDYDSTKGVRD